MDGQYKIRYRTWYKGLPPRQIKLEVPGWSGERNYESGQPWQCKPFVDGATYGLEIIYPFETEVIVSNDNNKVEFKCDSKDEWKDSGIDFPFAEFAENHFGFTSSLDIKTEKGYGILILPHSRYFTDMTGEVPLPSIGFLESDWWPKIFFIAFKSPLPGCKYVFKKGDGIAQIIPLPKRPTYDITPMTESEISERAKLDAQLATHGTSIATKKWTDKNGKCFDNKYKVLCNYNANHGNVEDAINNVEQIHNKVVQEKQLAAQHSLPRIVFLPEKNGSLYS